MLPEVESEPDFLWENPEVASVAAVVVGVAVVVAVVAVLVIALAAASSLADHGDVVSAESLPEPALASVLVAGLAFV